MTGDHFEDLMWQKLDGTISEQDESRLQQHLASDAAAVDQFDSLKRFSKLLVEVPEIDPPQALRQRIDMAIDPGRYAPSQAAISGSEWWRFLAVRPSLGLGLAVAAGILLGIVGYRIVGGIGDGLSVTELYGTISSGLRGNSIGEFHVDAPQAKGTITFQRRDDVIILEVDMVSENEVRIVIECAADAVQFGAARDTGNPLNRLMIDGNGITIHSDGEGRYHFLLKPSDESTFPIHLEVFAGDAILLDETVYATVNP